MGAPVRSVRVQPQAFGDRTVLAVEDGDRRSFDFGERVYVVDADGGEQVGVVTWDPVARWIVRLEERGSRLVPW